MRNPVMRNPVMRNPVMRNPVVIFIQTFGNGSGFGWAMMSNHHVIALMFLAIGLLSAYTIAKYKPEVIG